MFVHKLREEVQEAFRGFFFQDYRFGQQSVAEAVAGGVFLTGCVISFSMVLSGGSMRLSSIFVLFGGLL